MPQNRRARTTRRPGPFPLLIVTRHAALLALSLLASGCAARQRGPTLQERAAAAEARALAAEARVDSLAARLAEATTRLAAVDTLVPATPARVGMDPTLTTTLHSIMATAVKLA